MPVSLKPGRRFGNRKSIWSALFSLFRPSTPAPTENTETRMPHFLFSTLQLHSSKHGRVHAVEFFCVA